MGQEEQEGGRTSRRGAGAGQEGDRSGAEVGQPSQRAQEERDSLAHMGPSDWEALGRSLPMPGEAAAGHVPTAAVCPFSEAIMRGVLPSLSVVSTSAWWRRSSCKPWTLSAKAAA